MVTGSASLLAEAAHSWADTGNEVFGPRKVVIIGYVDLAGDDTEPHVAVQLRTLEGRISASPAVAGAVLSLSAPDEPSLSP